MKCVNGGINVVNDGICFCICIGGFIGFDCIIVLLLGCIIFIFFSLENMFNVIVGDVILWFI